MTEARSDPPNLVGLLRETTVWSLAVLALAVIIGTAVTRGYRFGLACLLGAIVDIGTFALMQHVIRDLPADTWPSGGRLLGIFGFRVAAKAAALVLAVLLPVYLDLWGAVLGVTIVDLTLVTVGSAAMSLRTMRQRAGTGPEGG